MKRDLKLDLKVSNEASQMKDIANSIRLHPIDKQVSVNTAKLRDGPMLPVSSKSDNTNLKLFDISSIHNMKLCAHSRMTKTSV